MTQPTDRCPACGGQHDDCRKWAHESHASPASALRDQLNAAAETLLGDLCGPAPSVPSECPTGCECPTYPNEAGMVPSTPESREKCTCGVGANPRCKKCFPLSVYNVDETLKKRRECEVGEWRFYIGSHVVIVDYDMLPILKQFTWHVKPNRKSLYVHTTVKVGSKSTSISMHRLLCGLPSSEIDHINRNGLDNRLANLRFCSKGENQRNRVRKNTHGYRGVYKHKDSPNYAVQIQIAGKKYSERGFKTAEEAARRYDELSKEHHGEFGIRNFKD